MADRRTARHSRAQSSAAAGRRGEEARGEGRGEEERETTTANKETQQQEAHTARNAGTSRETGHDRMDQRDGPQTKTQQPATKKNTATTRDDEQATRTQNQQTKRERESPGAGGAQEGPRPLVTRKITCNKKERQEKEPTRCVYEGLSQERKETRE